MFISPPPPPHQVPRSYVYLGLQYSPLPFLPVTSQCSWNQTAFSSSSSSSSSCSWRVRRISCFLLLKMKLVPPSLPRSSYVPSSFGLHCSACFSSLFVSISVYVVVTFNSILHFKLIQCLCFWHSWRFCQSHFITSILSTALLSVVPFVTSHAVLYWLFIQQFVDNMRLSHMSLHTHSLRPCVWSVKWWLRNLKVDVTWYRLKPSRNYTHTVHSELQYRWGPRYKCIVPV